VAPQFKIDSRVIGNNQSPYVVAEISANHGGSLEKALSIMEAAKSAGADAVKLQTYTADTMTIDHDGPGFYLEDGPWAGRTLYELYELAHTPWDWHQALFEKGRQLGIAVFSTPFDQTSVDFLAQFDPPAYKIASFELVDIPLIEYVARTGKPMIMSTGMADHEEISKAVQAARGAGCEQVCLLICTSGYPTPPEEINLFRVPQFAKDFNVSVGISDHTLGTVASIGAVSLGACLIEKHFTLNRSDGGPDAEFSLEPDELATLVANVRDTWRAVGSKSKTITESELPQRCLRRSLYVVEDVSEREQLTLANVRSIRPSFGLSPEHLPKVLGSVARVSIARGTPLTWDLIV